MRRRFPYEVCSTKQMNERIEQGAFRSCRDANWSKDKSPVISSPWTIPPKHHSTKSRRTPLVRMQKISAKTNERREEHYDWFEEGEICKVGK